MAAGGTKWLQPGAALGRLGLCVRRLRGVAGVSDATESLALAGLGTLRRDLPRRGFPRAQRSHADRNAPRTCVFGLGQPDAEHAIFHRGLDLIAIDGDPIANINSTYKVKKVVANGRVYDVADLVKRGQ